MVEVGKGKSDNNGTFEILCDYYDNQSGYYFKDNNIDYVQDIYPQKVGDTVDLDTLYMP